MDQRVLPRRRFVSISATVAVSGLAGCSSFGGSKSKSDSFHTSAENVDSTVVIYWFWGDGCPHCADQKPFMKELAQREEVAVVALEVYNSEANRKRLQEFANAYEISNVGVPMTFVGDEYWVGWAEEVKGAIESKVAGCLNASCPSPTANV